MTDVTNRRVLYYCTAAMVFIKSQVLWLTIPGPGLTWKNVNSSSYGLPWAVVDVWSVTDIG